jgi:UPF0716 protein FxsA
MLSKTFFRLLALFLLMPVIDLLLLIKVDGLIGFWPTVGLVLGTGVAGSYLARREGLSTWRRLNDEMAGGALPGKELLDGVIILVAGALLVTPGVITDVIGFLGLIPPTRYLIRKAVMRYAKRKMDSGSLAFGFFGDPPEGWDAYEGYPPGADPYGDGPLGSDPFGDRRPHGEGAYSEGERGGYGAPYGGPPEWDASGRGTSGRGASAGRGAASEPGGASERPASERPGEREAAWEGRSREVPGHVEEGGEASARGEERDAV